MADYQELEAKRVVGAHEALADLRAQAQPRGRRPHVALNMIVSVDGRVTKEGRSGGLSSPADRELFHALRAQADAVLVGASTVHIERYGPIIADEEVRARRRAAGLRPQADAVIASRGGEIDTSIPLFADAGSHVIVLGSGDAELGPTAARVDHVRTSAMADWLRELHERFEIGLLLCEGGPRLAGSLLAEGLVDELFLTLAPTLVGGPPGPTFLGSAALQKDLALSLRQLVRSGEELFARYAVS
jgi:riboflavin biosynthesis pyrimidine reductase